MNTFAQILQPADEYVPGILSGQYGINFPANRVIDANTREFVAALVPGGGVQDALAQLPLSPAEAATKLAASSDLASIAPMLKTMQIVSTVGALASVANLAVSCVGFALVLQRLSRIEGKLDDMMGKLDVLQDSVHRLHDHANALSLARLRSAGDSLDRALSASTPGKRDELASNARNLFQESRALYLELWRTARPWEHLTIPVNTALEMQSRYVACAIGEIQAEFIGGDMGTFRHAIETAVGDLNSHMRLDGPSAFRSRSDAASMQGPQILARFGQRMPELSAELRTAKEIASWTVTRLVAFAADADLPDQLGVEPHEIVRATRQAKGAKLYVLRRPNAA